MTTDLADAGTMSVGGGKRHRNQQQRADDHDADSVSYLGYDLETPAVAAVGPNGQLMVGVRESFALLDANLNAISTPSLGVPTSSVVSELRWVSGTTWLARVVEDAGRPDDARVVDTASNKPRRRCER